MNQSHEKPDRLVFSVNPLSGFDETQQSAAIPCAEEYLSRALGVPVHIILHMQYGETLAAMERAEISIARLGPYAFALAQVRFGAQALVDVIDVTEHGHDQSTPYRSIICTRSDSGITHLAQLKNQRFGFVDRNSTTGYLVATFLLQQAGLDASTDIQTVFCFSHAAVAEAVITGQVVAGALMEQEFSRYAQKSQDPSLRLLATSSLIPKGPIAVRPGFAPRLMRKLQQALIQLPQASPESARLFLRPTQSFVPAARGEMTLKTVAELAGVSYTTVSRAISGRGRVSSGTTARILKLVEELGYQPNANAHSLLKSRGNLIGLFLPGLNYPGIDEIIAGIQDVLSKVQMQVLLCPVGSVESGLPHQQAYFALLNRSRFGGVLLTQWSATSPEALAFIRGGHPMVLLEQDLLEEGLKTAWNWLREQGHQRVGVVVGQTSLLEPTITLHTLKQLTSLHAYEMQIFTYPSDQLTSLRQHPSTPTALLCTDDQTALNVYEALKQEFPHLVVLGIGNSQLAHWSGLPSLAFDGFALGQRAAQRLLRMLDISVPSADEQVHFWVQARTSIL